MSKNSLTKDIDFLQGPLYKNLVLFALPIAFSSTLQLLFNSVDAAVVGRFSGNVALAAVGSNGSIVGLFVGFFSGLSIGANVVISTYIGLNRKDKIKTVVHNCIALAIVSGLAVLLIGEFIAVPVHRLMSTPDEVIDLAVLYLRIFFFAVPFILVYNYGAAILRSKGDTRRPLLALLVSGIINLVLNLVLVIQFKLGVAGVAIATVISNMFGSGLIICWLCKDTSEIHLNLRELQLNKHTLKKVISIGLPAGMQDSIFSVSNICIQSAINSFGALAMAGNTAELYFEQLAYFFAAAFASATVTVVSQNYAAGQYDRCKKAIKYCLITAIISSFVLGIVMNIFDTPLLGIINRDPEVIEYGHKRMLIAVGLLFTAPFYDVLGGALRAMGHSLLPAIIVFFGTCIFRLVWVFTVVKAFHYIEVLFVVYPISWILCSIMTTIVYVRISKRCYSGQDRVK